MAKRTPHIIRPKYVYLVGVDYDENFDECCVYDSLPKALDFMDAHYDAICQLPTYLKGKIAETVIYHLDPKRDADFTVPDHIGTTKYPHEFTAEEVALIEHEVHEPIRIKLRVVEPEEGFIPEPAWEVGDIAINLPSSIDPSSFNSAAVSFGKKIDPIDLYEVYICMADPNDDDRFIECFINGVGVLTDTGQVEYNVRFRDGYKIWDSVTGTKDWSSK